ncbi:FAD-dependent oxidoreductase [Streptomyces sp. wa1063]|uniref:FAD-dependent oxidoreductase n=1 Tax=Streptomyces sp. wa1063 TaxID=1828212 RepID=UPI0027BAB15A|nr:FAD-dependent oxidoreductase [Streptomyces sp. wa1063]
MSESADLVVVGAGPAGMAAAATALDGGLRVVLIDSGAAPGGQFWRCLLYTSLMARGRRV